MQKALGVALVLVALVPGVVRADFQLSFAPTFQATHSGATIFNGNPDDPLVAPEQRTIRASELGGVSPQWHITQLTSQMSDHDIIAERGAYVLARIDFENGGLEGGAAVRGVNYDVVHTSWIQEGPHEHDVTFSLPQLGSGAVSSGYYELYFVEMPETKDVYDPETDTTSTLPFSEDDLGRIIAGDSSFFANTTAQVSFSAAASFYFDADVVLEAGCTQECYSNVLFLPGIESSRLYRPLVVGSGEDRLWEPAHNDDVRDLYLGLDGTPVRDDVYAKVGDVLDELPVTGANVYQSFINMMDGLKADGHINDWTAAAYDWRFSLDQILTTGSEMEGKLYYAGPHAATSTPYIIQELRRLAATSKSGKVTVIAHSNGGLVAKRLTQVLGEEASTLIDQIIFVASPQAGTPMALAADLHGHDQSYLGGLILTSQTARTFASTSPMSYNLLPSAQYFTYVDDPVVTFDSTLPDWAARYGTTIHSSETLRTFLTDSYGRVDSQTGDASQPIQMHGQLYDSAAELHASLDAWVPPAGIEVMQIAGWGVPTTISGLTYSKAGSGVQYAPNFTIDGDGTVVVPSALWTSEAENVKQYWVNLRSYNTNHPLQTALGFMSLSHANILEVNDLLVLISDKIKRQTSPVSPHITSATPLGTDSRLRFSLHSPLSINLFDEQGRHTGISTSTGQIEEQIPGTYYVEFDDVKYIFSDASSSANVLMRGYATGTFSFVVDQFDGNTITASSTWRDIPSTPDAIVTSSVQSNISTLAPLSIDTNGDGTSEWRLGPALNDVVTIPPKPSLVVTASNRTIEIGSPLPILSSTLSGYVDGIPNDVTGSAFCTTTATPQSGAGTYPIVCSRGTLASRNYEFGTFVAGTLTIAYRCDGFTEPINNRGREVRDERDDSGERDDIKHNPSVFKAESTVPVKFQLRDWLGRTVRATTSPLWYPPQKGASTRSSIDESLYSEPADSGVSYQSNGDHYRYNWKTKGLARGYWYRLYAKLGNGQLCSVTVGLK